MVKFVSQPLELYNTGTADALYLESSDADALAGPVITLKRNSPSPASADYIGQLKFKGESSTGADRVYAKITAKIDDPTNAAEDGVIEFMNRFNGSEQIALRLKEDSFRTLNDVNLFVAGNTGLGQNSASERLDVLGNIAVSGTVDGRDVGTDGTNQDALQTLTGVSAAATDLGTFTGTTIADNVTVKDALQDLEDAAIPSGGASGTILAKASAADYDTEWIAQTAAISSVSQDSSPALGGNLAGSNNDISGVNAYSGASLSLTGNITVDGTVDGRDVAADGTKLDGIEPNATADQTAADIRALGFFDTTNDGTGSGLDADTVDGVEASAFLLADGSRALSGSLDMGGNAIVDATSISGATLVQASTVRTDSLRPISGTTTADIGGGGEPFRNLTLSGNLTITGTVDGRDVAADGTKLDGIESGATNTNDPLADANQTITASRTIDDGDNGYQLFVDLNNGGASTAQLLVSPATPTVTLATNAGSAATTSLIQVKGSSVDLTFGSSSGLTINSATGSDGQALVTSGSGAPPEWGGYTVHRGTSAPTNTNMLWYNTTEEELFTYDSGRGHWFGAPIYVSMGKTTSTTAGTGHFLYLGHQGTTATTSERGWLVPHDMTITGLRGHTQSTFDGWRFRVDKNNGQGTNTEGVVNTGVLGAVDTYTDFTLDADVNAADIIGMAGVLGSVTLNNTTFTIELRRRL